VSLNDPKWYTNSDLKAIFNTRSAFDETLARSKLSFPPSLAGVLTLPTPPPFAYFLSLPAAKHSTKHWGVYAICLQKHGYTLALLRAQKA